MGTLPGATTRVQATAAAVSAGADLICIWAPVASNADATPRIFGSAAAAYAFHGYSEGLEYAAMHVEETGKPFAMVGLPIVTAGAIGREDVTGNTGSATTTITPGDDGCLTEHDGVLRVKKGGTVGTDQIVLELSLDGGRKFKVVRLGTAYSYVFPYIGARLDVGAGTLTTGDTIHTWHGTGPLSDSDGWADARAAMAEQLTQYRSVMLCGDLQNSTEANAVQAQADAYETANDRYIYVRASVRDRTPVATMSYTRVTAAGVFNTTFAEVGGTGDTITRSAGSFVTDGFLATDFVTVAGSASNNFARAKLTAPSVSALVLTLDTQDLTAEGPVAGVKISGVGRLTFSTSGKTVTRTRGSWISDGFRVGDLVNITGTNSNNLVNAEISTVTATVITFAGDVTTADETIAADVPTITAGLAKAAWMASVDAAFAAVTGMRIDLSAGRACKLSPFTGWNFRRPAAWAASIREYQHDLHRATWRKDAGPLAGWDLFDDSGLLIEWDDRVDGGAGCAARFTTFRTWGNGPKGAFIALALTRYDENSLLSMTHNVAVVNLACTAQQRMAENAVGRDFILKADGTATTEDLKTIASEVNTALRLVLMSDTMGEGQRASSAVWAPSDRDVLNTPTATLNGVLTLNLKGTIHTVNTTVRVLQGGQQ